VSDRPMTEQFLKLKHGLRRKLYDEGVHRLPDKALVFKVDKTLFEEILEENRADLGDGIVDAIRDGMKLYGVPIEFVDEAFDVEVRDE